MRRLRNPSFEKITAIAHSFLPSPTDGRTAPPTDLPSPDMAADRGQMLLRALCDDGVRQKAKVDRVLGTMPRKLFQGTTFDVVDWQCGQGVNTVCFFDFIRRNGMENRVQQVFLIDTDAEAMERALWHLEPYMGDTDRIVTIHKPINEVDRFDIETHQPVTFHFFTDVLGHPEIDLRRLAQLIGRTIRGEHYFFCVDALKHGNDRLETFYRCFNSPELFTDETYYPTARQPYAMTCKAFRLRAETFGLNTALSPVQWQAAFRLDIVRELLQQTECEKVAALYRSLSRFEVSAGYDVAACAHNDLPPLLAVLSNLITRGLPTAASPLLEEAFAPLGNRKRWNEEGRITYAARDLYPSDLFEALHLIDPRFKPDETTYNVDALESDLQREYITRVAPPPFRQLFEPQRNVYTLTGQREYCTQHVDFSLEFPYPTKDLRDVRHNGFVIEIEDPTVQTTMDQRRIEKQRTDDLAAMNWTCETFSDGHLSDMHFGYLDSDYVRTAFRVFSRPFDSEWVRTLQYVLTPIGVARIEKVILEALMAGRLDLAAPHWEVLVVERDVPCAVAALSDLRALFERLTALSAEWDGVHFPEVTLDVISTPEFIDSPLHADVVPSAELTEEHRAKTYDLIIDISVLRRAGIERPLIGTYTNCHNDCCFIVRSAHHAREPRRVLTTGRITYRPLIIRDAIGRSTLIPETAGAIHYIMGILSRREDFRPGQEAILDRLLRGESVAALLPTDEHGAAVALPAALLQPGVTVVITPDAKTADKLIDEARQQDIDCGASLHTNMTDGERERRERRVESAALHFVAISAEQLARPTLQQRFLSMRETGVYFAYGILDSAERGSEWSPFFDPHYLCAGKILRRYARPREGTITLGATLSQASFDMLFDVERELLPVDSYTPDRDRIVTASATVAPMSLESRSEAEEGKDIEQILREMGMEYIAPVLGSSSAEEARLVGLSYPTSAGEGGESTRDKAAEARYIRILYRMGCLGLIDGVARDEAQKRFLLVVRDCTAEQVYKRYCDYFNRYYTRKRAEREETAARAGMPAVVLRDEREGTIYKYLTGLTHYVCDNIARLAPDTASHTPLTERLAQDLADDSQATDEVLFRYLHLVNDSSEGSHKGRIHALHESVCTLRRAVHTHPVLLLLNTFCLLYLGTGDRATLEQDLSTSYEQGIVGLYHLMPDYARFQEQFEAYNRFVRNEADATDDATEARMKKAASRLLLIRAADILSTHLTYTTELQRTYLG